MAIKSGIQTITIHGNTAIPYTQTGTYKKEQIVLHPQFGFGTVLRVRYGKVVIRFGSESQNRTFLCGMMTLDQRNEANGLAVAEAPRVKLSKRSKALVDGFLLQQDSRQIEADDIPFSMETFMNQLLDCTLDDAS